MKRNTTNGKILKIQTFKKTKYCYVDFCVRGEKIHKTIHRLVAMAFIPNPENKYYINHKDFNPSNNRVDNLEWCTQSENVKYTYECNPQFKKGKKVNQYDKKGNYIKTFISVNEASRSVDTSPSNIIECCKGNRKSVKGYWWSY